MQFSPPELSLWSRSCSHVAEGFTQRTSMVCVCVSTQSYTGRRTTVNPNPLIYKRTTDKRAPNRVESALTEMWSLLLLYRPASRGWNPHGREFVRRLQGQPQRHDAPAVIHGGAKFWERIVCATSAGREVLGSLPIPDLFAKSPEKRRRRAGVLQRESDHLKT